MLTLLLIGTRAGGVRIGPRKALAARRALRAIDRADPVEHYLALRGALAPRAADHAVFDAAYSEAFADRPGHAARTGRRSLPT